MNAKTLCTRATFALIGPVAAITLVLLTDPASALANGGAQSACLEFEDPKDPESDCIYSHGWGGDEVPLEGICAPEGSEDHSGAFSPEGIEDQGGASTFAQFRLGQVEEEPICELEEEQTTSQLPPIPQPSRSFISRDCSTGQQDLDARFAVLYQFWMKYIKVGDRPVYGNPDRVEVYAEVCLPPHGLLGNNRTAKIVDLNGTALVSGSVNGWSGFLGPRRSRLEPPERYQLQARVNARQLDHTVTALREEMLQWARRTVGQEIYLNVTARFLTGEAVLTARDRLGGLSYSNQQGREVRASYKVQATQKYPLLK